MRFLKQVIFLMNFSKLSVVYNVLNTKNYTLKMFIWAIGDKQSYNKNISFFLIILFLVFLLI